MLKYIGIIALAMSSCGLEPSHYDLKVGGNRELLGQDLISRYTVKLEILVKQESQAVLVGSCSGAVLAPRFILTAAHCVTLNPWRVKVVVGGDHPIELAQGKSYSEVAEVEAAIFHSRYNKASRKMLKQFLLKYIVKNRSPVLYDVAVLKLKQPLNLPYKINFSIPKNIHNLRGRNAVVAGFGIGDMGQVPRRGRQANNKIADNFYDLLQFNNFFNRMNFGDSGGPVWYYNGSKLELIGVNSFMLWILRLRAYAIDVRIHRQWVYDAIETLKSDYNQPPSKDQHLLIMPGVAEDAFVQSK